MRKTGRHTFVIDGNYFLFRTLYVLPRKSKKGELLGSKEDVQSFMRKLATDFAYQIRLFEGLIDKVVWTVDSRSWRKDFYPEADYKGNRKQDSSINWANFSKTTEEFLQMLSKQGVIISKTGGAEGDDLMYAWNTESLANGKSVIMFTGDRDLVQLVNKNDNNNTHTILFSPAHKKLYTYQGFSEWIDEESDTETTDIFDMMKISSTPEAQSKKLLKGVLTKKKVNVVEVDPEEFRFRKVLTGDAGDNVPPAYWYVSKPKKGNPRRYGISEKKATDIITEFKDKHGSLSHMYLYEEGYITDLANITIRHMKAKHMSREQIISNIKSNVQLMVLSSHTIPEGILDEMFRSVESKMDLNHLKLPQISTMKSLLEGTEYLTDDNTAIKSAIFRGDKDDNSDDFSFITNRKTKGKIF
jgi:5'-3' exonuclease|tara:strand:- start:1218 stop:2456 length:1239 start_codon:yes stop_codon:yes gene_type:complete